MSDPFAADPFAADSGDQFDVATNVFVGPEDLDGRLLVVKPYRKENKKGRTGDPYVAIFADVVVLTGPVTDKIEAVPCVLEDVMFSSQGLSRPLENKLRNPKGKPFLAGVVDSQPSQYNKHVRAYMFKEPDAAQFPLCRRGVQLYNQHCEAGNGNDPFSA